MPQYFLDCPRPVALDSIAPMLGYDPDSIDGWYRRDLGKEGSFAQLFPSKTGCGFRVIGTPPDSREVKAAFEALATETKATTVYGSIVGVHAPELIGLIY